MTVKTEAQLTAKDGISPVLDGVERSLEKFRIGVETNSRGIRKLENGFENVAIQATRLDGNLGMLADGLIEFAPGGFVGLAAIAGIAAIIKYFQDLDKQTEASRKHIQELDIEFKRLSGNAIGAQQDLVNIANRDVLNARANVERLQQRLTAIRNELASPVIGGEEGLGGLAAASIVTERQLKAAQVRLIELQKTARNSAQELKNTATQEEEKKRREEEQRQKEIASRKTQVDLLIELSKLSPLTAAQVTVLRTAEQNITNQLDNGNISLQQRINLLKQLGEITDAVLPNMLKPLPPMPPATTTQLPRPQGPPPVTSVDKATMDRIAASDRSRDLKTQEAAAGALESKMQELQPYFLAGVDAISAMSAALVTGENAFAAFGKSAVDSIRMILQSIARQNIVEGLSALAQAAGAAFKNPAAVPGFLASAKLHFAAAAAAGVGAGIAGGIGARGGASGGGIGGRGGLNNSSLGQGGAGQGTVTINITGGGILDMTNADTQRSFVRALESVTNKRAVILGV